MDKLASNWQNYAQVRLQPKFAFGIRVQSLILFRVDCHYLIWLWQVV